MLASEFEYKKPPNPATVIQKLEDAQGNKYYDAVMTNYCCDTMKELVQHDGCIGLFDMGLSLRTQEIPKFRISNCPNCGKKVTHIDD